MVFERMIRISHHSQRHRRPSHIFRSPHTTDITTSVSHPSIHPRTNSPFLINHFAVAQKRHNTTENNKDSYMIHQWLILMLVGSVTVTNVHEGNETVIIILLMSSHYFIIFFFCFSFSFASFIYHLSFYFIHQLNINTYMKSICWNT